MRGSENDQNIMSTIHTHVKGKKGTVLARPILMSITNYRASKQNVKSLVKGDHGHGKRTL